MKKIILCLMAMATLTACQNDDTDFSAYTNGETTTSTTSTIYITYSGTAVTVSGDSKGYVTTSGADVTVNTGTDTDSLLLVLSGTTTDGSLLVYREKKFGIQLNGVNITNQDGPAINNQCSKSLYMVVADGTTNTLADGTAYDESVSYQQKGALFSEGQIYFSGSGALTVTGSTKNAIACDDYIVVNGSPTITAITSTGNSIKVNDGIITDVSFITFGCGSAIASSSMATEMIKGMPIQQALELSNKAVTEALDGLPAHKLHCSVLAEEAVRAAVKDYYDKNGIAYDPEQFKENDCEGCEK